MNTAAGLLNYGLLNYGLLDEAQCDRLIQDSASLRSREGLIYSNPHTLQGSEVDHARYKARERYIDLMPPFDWLREVLRPAIVACLNHFEIPGLVCPEMPRVLMYGVGDHFAWHVDTPAGFGSIWSTSSPRTEPSRQITGSIQLSAPESYAGGDLLVSALGEVKTASRARGDVAMFPAEWMHQASPVTSGERVALVFWAYA